VLSINWIFDSFKKRAIVKIAIKNERSKQILDDLWSLPISRKLTRITQGENKEEVLVNRRKHRLILEDMHKAINIKINYGNTFLFWRDISGVERPDRRSTSAIKWNRKNLPPDSDKEKKVVNGFSKNASKLNQKNILYEKKIMHSHNKENESGETTKFKNQYDEDKRKEGHNAERSRYIESLDKKLQIILQRLDKIEANRLRDGDKIAKGEQKNQLAVEDWLPLQRSQSQNIQPKQKEGEETGCAKEEEVELYKRITRVGAVKKWLIDKNLMVEDKTEGALDSIWEALEKGILETAIKHIPKKKICKTRVARDGKKGPRLDKLIIELGRDMTKEDRKDFGLFRKNIKKKFQIEIENIGRKWEDKDIENLKQGRMLASLLEKPFNHDVVDKLLENQNNTRVLTCDPEKVKEKTKEFF
ncbi:36860_t:CDS:2, partial [Gigaspora margarita]